MTMITVSHNIQVYSKWRGICSDIGVGLALILADDCLPGTYLGIWQMGFSQIWQIWGTQTKAVTRSDVSPYQTSAVRSLRSTQP